MKLVRGLHNFSRPADAGRNRGCVLTVGNYDGVHLGHQRVIELVKQRAAELDCTPTVLVFEPSSREFIDPVGAPARLTRWREKFLALESLGVQTVVTLRFDQHMRTMSPSDFVEELIVAGLRTRHLVVGDDFRYGSRAEGTIASLRAAGDAHGFGVEQMAPFVMDGLRVSSTSIRARLELGECEGAARLLGRRYRMMGRVVHGEKLGRTLGFPTANLRLMRRKSPLWGILAVRVYGIGEKPLTGVASLGTRPTVNGVEPLLEVHIFDFAGDLYGRPIEVEFIAKLRGELKFDSLDDMVVQMKTDAEQAREVLSRVARG